MAQPEQSDFGRDVDMYWLEEKKYELKHSQLTLLPEDLAEAHGPEILHP